jgi:pimeloyl-ACP methyl ester carboxylesterase
LKQQVTEPAPRLHVEIHGEGPAVVLGHGFGGSARNFRLQVRTLRERLRLVLFDARGHARSEAPREAAAYRPEAFVADLGRVLDQAGEARAVVGGLSMGAALALRFARAHPERVRGLVLAAPPPGAGASPRGREWALAFADAIERDGLEAAGACFVWGPESRLDPDAARLVRLGFLEHPPHALAHTLRELLAVQPAPEAAAEGLAALGPRVLVIVGAEDPLSGGAAEALHRVLPGSQLVRIEGAGHVVNLAAPAAFDAALLEWVSKLESGT